MEFRDNFSDSTRRRFEKQGQLLRVCPEDFFDDLAAALEEYFAKLKEDNELLDNFKSRFDEVYPN